MVDKILTLSHGKRLHKGYQRTLDVIREKYGFHWYKMTQHVINFINNCYVCGFSTVPKY